MQNRAHICGKRAMAAAVLEVLESRQLLSAIEGHIYAADGSTPLPDISVSVYQSDVPNDGGQSANQWVSGTVTNADGSFLIDGLEARSYHISVQDNSSPVHYLGQNLYDVAVDADTVTQDFDLQPASSISGRVSAFAGGALLSGVQIDVYQSSDPKHAGSDAWDWVGSTTTNADGNYTIGGLEAPRDYRIAVSDGQQDAKGNHYIAANLYDVATVAAGTTTSGMNLQLRQAGVIYGYVYDSSNHPIPNAQVVTEASYTRADNDNSWHTAQTDANGRYALYLPLTDQSIYPVRVVDAAVAAQPGQYYAVQIAPGLYSSTSGGTHGYDFHLSLGATISGRAVTASGQPIANMNVAEPDVHIANGTFNDSPSNTDNQGYYEIQGVPANTPIYLSTDDWGWPDFSIDGVKYAQGTRLLGPFTVAAGATLNIGDLVIPQAGTIGGVITDTHGNPILGAAVRIRGVDAMGGSVDSKDSDNGGAESDGLGQYEASSLPPGRYQVQVSKDGWVSDESAELVVTSGQVVQHDVVLHDASSGVTVSGTISNFSQVGPRNSLGQSLPFNLIDNYDRCDRGSDMGVVAMPQGIAWTAATRLDPQWLFTGETSVNDGFADYYVPDSQDAAGTFQLSLPAQPQWLLSYRNVPNGLGTVEVLLSDPMAVDATAGSNVTANITAPAGTSKILGQITLPAGYRMLGRDVNGTSVTIWLKDISAGASPMGRALTACAPSGQYALAGLPAGTYTLYVVAPGLQPFSSGAITVTAGQAVTYNFSLSAGAAVSGYVRSGDIPVANAVVRSSNTGFTTVTDATGHYVLPGLLPGSDTLLVQRTGYTDVQQAVTLSNGQQTAPDFDVEGADASITGRVIAGLGSNGCDDDHDGAIDEPDEDFPSGITVVAYNKDLAKSYVAYTNDQGVYNFEDLAPGNYRLIASGGAYDSSMYPLAANPDLVVGHDHTDLTESGSQIMLAPVQPKFTVSSTSDAATLDITIHSDMDLQAWPQLSLVQGAGALGNPTPIDARTVSVRYTLGAGDKVVQIQVRENPDHAVVNGSPSSRTFSFDVTSQLEQVTGTNFFNAQGATLGIMGSQDNATVYLPPFALTTDDSGLTQATTLTICRYGEPGQALDSSHTSVASSYDFVIGDSGVTGVTLSHHATMTMNFSVPKGMSEATFRMTLRVGFYNNSQAKWVWNDLANSNPTSGISNIQINWLSNTLTFEAAHFTKFALSVVPNKAPTAISLSRTTALQGWPKWTPVATLAATDPNAGDTATFALVSGSGSTSNSLFRIVGNVLQTNGALYYSKGYYSIRLQAKDLGGLTYQKAFSIKMTGINAAPKTMALSRASVAENAPIGAIVGTFSCTDANSGDTFTYSLVTGTGSTGNSKFTISGSTLKTNAIFDYEAAKSYSIRVRVADRGGMSFIKVFTIGVTNVNEKPSGVTLSPAAVLENKPVGTTVGTLSGHDPDAGSLLTYSLAPGGIDSMGGGAGADNGSFTVSGNRLQTAAVFDFETKSSYSILVRVKDQGGLFSDVPLIITIGDVLE